MSILKELEERKAALDREIAEIKARERAEAIAKARALMAEHNLRPADLTVSTRVHATAGRKISAKYRDRESGNEWSGRGLQPVWLKARLNEGRPLSDFTI